MQDLNDLYYFAEIVSHGGFAAAGRALKTPKSKLSRRIAQLEERLGVRLIERSTRRFQVTEVGKAFYERCCAVLLEAEGAEAVVAEARGEPHGLVRFSCPSGILGAVRPMIAAFLAKHRQVRLQVLDSNRRMDLIEERIDVALRVRESLEGDASLTMRKLGASRLILVASPLLAGIEDIRALASLPTLSASEQAGEDVWSFIGPGDVGLTVRHTPRLACGDFSVLCEAAVAGLGFALLPDHSCQGHISDGSLVPVLPDWRQQDGIVHLVFTTRRLLPPAVRAFIDHLAAGFRDGGWRAPPPG